MIIYLLFDNANLVIEPTIYNNQWNTNCLYSYRSEKKPGNSKVDSKLATNKRPGRYYSMLNSSKLKHGLKRYFKTKQRIIDPKIMCKTLHIRAYNFFYSKSNDSIFYKFYIFIFYIIYLCEYLIQFDQNIKNKNNLIN